MEPKIFQTCMKTLNTNLIKFLTKFKTKDIRSLVLLAKSGFVLILIRVFVLGIGIDGQLYNTVVPIGYDYLFLWLLRQNPVKLRVTPFNSRLLRLLKDTSS